MEQDRIGKAMFAHQLCWRTVCTSDYSLADASSYSVLTMYLGGYRKSISKQLIDGILAAEPQHRVLARRHHHAGIGTMHNCVVQIGIGETTHRRSDISARSSCWDASACASNYFLTDAFRYSVSNMKILSSIWIAAATNRQA